MKLKKIFKKASTGKIVEWEIEIVENKYRTITGQKNGKKIINQWTVCEGKNLGKTNETSPEQQALKEAQASRTKKLEKDYKESEEEVSDIGYFKPMLAHEYKENSFQTFELPIFCQPKLDGIRGELFGEEMKSRNGKLFTSVPHIVEEFIFKVAENYPSISFDGELYNHEYKENFNEIASIVKRQKLTDDDLYKSKTYMQYWVYDLFDFENPKLKFDERFKLLTDIFKTCDLSDSFVRVPTTLIRTEGELDKKYEQYVEDGYEGQMVRLNREYENKRSKFLLKRKEFITEEFIVLDIT